MVLNSIQRSRPLRIEDVWTRYFPRLVALAQKTLRHLPHREEDARDAAQSAFLSFWQRLDKSGLEATIDRNSLWGLLATITTRKARQIVRKEFAQKRGAGQVLPFTDVSEAEDGVRVSQLIEDVSSADFDLACEERMLQLPEDLRPFAMLRLLGHTNVEISHRMSCSERKVERKLNLIRSYWQVSE